MTSNRRTPDRAVCARLVAELCRRGVEHRIPPVELACARAVVSGETLREAARLAGVETPQVVIHWLSRFVQRAPFWLTRPATIPDDMTLCRMVAGLGGFDPPDTSLAVGWAAGVSIHELAAEVGLSRPTATRRLRAQLAVIESGRDDVPAPLLAAVRHRREAWPFRSGTAAKTRGRRAAPRVDDRGFLVSLIDAARRGDEIGPLMSRVAERLGWTPEQCFALAEELAAPRSCASTADRRWSAAEPPAAAAG